MYRENSASDFEKVQKEFISLLEWLRFSEIRVNRNDKFPSPSVVETTGSQSIIPAITAEKNGTNYLFEIFTEDIHKLPEKSNKLINFCLYAHNRSHKEAIMVIPFGKKESITRWCNTQNIPTPPLWEITITY